MSKKLTVAARSGNGIIFEIVPRKGFALTPVGAEMYRVINQARNFAERLKNKEKTCK